MNIKRYRQFDFSLGIQDATTWILKKPNELQGGENLDFGKTIGAATRRDGYTPVGDPFATNKSAQGGHIAYFSTGTIRLAAVNNTGNTNTLVRSQNISTGVWTDIITDLPADSEVFFFTHLDEVYVTGYSRVTKTPFTPRNIDKTLNVSSTRNILNMPPCYYLVEYVGQLYACNVLVNGVRYPDRTYYSSPPMGFPTTVQGAQTDVTTLKVDTVKYLKVGMSWDVYKAGTETFMYTITITAVDKANNTITYAANTQAVGSVNATTDVITVTDATRYPTGTPIVFTGTPPGGLTAGTIYYAINLSTTTIKVATSAANAAAGTAIDLTSSGTSPSIRIAYTYADNDELWLTGRKNKLTMFWNTDHPTPEDAQFIFIKPGSDSSNEITGTIKSNNRLFLFTKNSTSRYDGSNFPTINSAVGCISHRTLKTLDDDWMIWVDASGNVWARNENGGQQENISRGIRTKIMQKVSQTNLLGSNAGTADNQYRLYIGTVDGRNTRVVYDFNGNTWTIEKLGRQPLVQFTDDSTGYVKPYFLADNGKLYVDKTGNTDDGDVIPFEMQTGRDMFQTEQIKKFYGILIFSENATGLKIMVSVDGGDFKTVGEITSRVNWIKFPENGTPQDVLEQGVTFDWKIVGAIEGDAPKIEGAVVYYTVEENVPSERR